MKLTRLPRWHKHDIILDSVCLLRCPSPPHSRAIAHYKPRLPTRPKMCHIERWHCPDCPSIWGDHLMCPRAGQHRPHRQRPRSRQPPSRQSRRPHLDAKLLAAPLPSPATIRATIRPTTALLKIVDMGTRQCAGCRRVAERRHLEKRLEEYERDERRQRRLERGGCCVVM